MKTIVTHISPDLDAIASVWLVKRFLHGFEHAEISFVPAGKTLNDAAPDEDPQIIHVDTGLGQFDHHQLTERTSAARRVFDHILEKDQIKRSHIPALERIVEVVTMYDNFGEVFLSDPTADVYNFSLNELISGLKSFTQNNHETVEKILPMFDALLISMKVKVSAETELSKGVTLQTRWGRSLIVETQNDEVLKLGLKSNYTFVARIDPERRYIRIKTFPNADYRLDDLATEIKTADQPHARWYLHPTGNMLLNNNTADPEKETTALTTQQLIAIIQRL